MTKSRDTRVDRGRPTRANCRLRDCSGTASAQRLEFTRTLAQDLLDQFELTDWQFAFMSRRATWRFGDCDHSRKLIRLSPVLTEMNHMGEVEDTLRHEIAHALCDPSDGHNARFYAKCIEVGARQERCYGPDVNRPGRKRKPDRYRRRCITCDSSRRYRGHLSADRACGECGTNLVNERRGQCGWEMRSRWTARCALYAFDMLDYEDVHEDDMNFGIVAQVAFDEPRRCEYCESHLHDWEWVSYEA